LQNLSYLQNENAGYIDELFNSYSQDPSSVDPSWRYFFEGLELGIDTESRAPQTSQPGSPVQPQTTERVTAAEKEDWKKESKVAELILAYRELGRLLADINPLMPPSSSHPLLEMSRFGLSSSDLTQTFSAGHLIGMGPARLSEILSRLKETYCGPIGFEFTHIEDRTERDWVQSKLESTRSKEILSPETQKFILKRLSESETFERFLHTRYVAQKRFSIEGAESLIPALDCMIEVGGDLGVEEFVMGMAHRGRLNVLTHIFGKKPQYIFTEFEGAYKADLSLGEGDVKYHMGFSADLTTRNGKSVHLSLASNPSHLEFVNPVIEGVTRAKQEQRQDDERKKVIPVAMHGDAAFAGQGVCYETLNLSQLRGYGVGGTIHIVINNQVGFTTSPFDSRSTPYCTDLAKMLDVPILHVNGDHPEAMWFASKLAIEYRQKFKKDFVIDLVCYRKHGHNEGDEPTFTQPLLYKKIKVHTSTRELYAERLTQQGVVKPEEAQAIVQKVTDHLTEAQARTRAEAPRPYVSAFEARWKHLRRPQDQDIFAPTSTSVDEKTLRELAKKLNSTPSGFHIHPKLVRFFEARQKAVDESKGIDWGNAEALAYASLLTEGYGIRLSGQDAERGTFTHRHSVLYDFETGETYCPLNQLKAGQARYQVHNSHLSEMAVMGFEYGYSLAEPNTLTLWEAQFGDFANGAQVMIDQFICSSESKWQRMSGLTLLLPHGYEGQGPEHSSARLERFLQLCGKNNMIVGNFSTPAQFFHALRRQVHRPFRKPLVVMSPKSMLRNPLAVSTLDDFTKQVFQEVLDDPKFSSASSAKGVRRILLCTGKVYYDLVNERESKEIKDVAIVRVEQLYPWPAELLSKILARYPKSASLVWVQEEPRNMGAWSYIFGTWSGGLDLFQEKVGGRALSYVGREVGASPAIGSHKEHEKEQTALIQKAFL
jgi:2-oxoglutarate dehydrogenase E1 component